MMLYGMVSLNQNAAVENKNAEDEGLRKASMGGVVAVGLIEGSLWYKKIIGRADR